MNNSKVLPPLKIELDCYEWHGGFETLWDVSLPLVLTFLFFFFIRDFLPRGSGIVTRRPLILQLVNNKAGECVDHSSVVYMCVKQHAFMCVTLSCWLTFEAAHQFQNKVIACCKAGFHDLFPLTLISVCRICWVLTLQREEVCGLRWGPAGNWSRDRQDNRV